MRYPSLLLLFAITTTAVAQRPELAGTVVRDSVLATLHRDLAEGLWAEERTSGELKGNARLELVIDDKGRCESVRMVESDLPIAWKNRVKDQWFDRRFDFKLAKHHKEKITVELQFP